MCLVLAGLVSPWASTAPDGLEKVAQDKGFLDKAAEKPAWSGAPMPDYALPGAKHESVATSLAGMAGTLLVFAGGYGLARIVARNRRTGSARVTGEA
jgi:cobalt/nickel transport protein